MWVTIRETKRKLETERETMAKVKIYFRGEDLTDGKGTVISLTAVREIESQGLVVVLCV